MLLLSQIWPLGTPLSWPYIFFYKSPSFFEDFVTFWCSKRFQAHLILFLPQPWNQPFLRRALVLFTRMTETKIWEQNMVNVLRCFLSVYTYIHTYAFLSIHPSLIIPSIFKILNSLFFSVLGLHCCARATLWLPCSGFFLCLVLWSTYSRPCGSAVVACGRQSTGSVAPRHVESSWTKDGPVSPALARGFLTTGLPGKSSWLL